MKKGARYLIALFVILSLNFLIPRLMPGDPITNLMGEDFIVDQETMAQLKKELGLDRPLIVQYGRYWRDIFRLDLGYSYHFHEKVTGLVFARAQWTVLLVGISILLGSLCGGFLGALSGWRSHTIVNKAATSLFLAVYSTPSFFLSLALLYIFAYKFGLFPLRGLYETGSFVDIIHHLFLPVLVMTLFLVSRNYMIMRGSVLQEKGKSYVLGARAKGLSSRQILFRHVLKNASLPLVTLVALDFGFIFSGAIFVEIVFSLNGMGTLIYDALLSRDYPVLQGVFLFITVMVVLANFTADIVYGLLDPRMRSET